MRKLLLAISTLALLAPMAPAHATVTTYVRTIVAPTTFGDGTGVISIPDIINQPSNPNSWSKIGTSTTAARCGFLKQVDGTLPAGTSQDATTGKFGYVVPLPSAFAAGDRFSLVSHSTNPADFDFDVVFFTSLGKCAYDRTVSLPAGQGCATVPLEGSAPTPPPSETQQSATTCFPQRYKSMFTTIGNDAGTLSFNANYAIVVMPAGANGKFALQLIY